MKKLSVTITAIALLVVTFTVSAEEFKGNWTEVFQLKDGTTVVHTPNYVRMGFLQSGKQLHIQTPYLNGMPVSKCGIHLATDSTREEFVDALKCAEVI